MGERQYRELTDDQLEGLIRALPRRQPPEALRNRVLSQAGRTPTRLAPGLRPAFAFVVLVVLLLADWLVLRSQSTGVLCAPSPQATVARAGPVSREETGLVRDLAAAGLPLRLAMGHPDLQAETYLDLRNLMLTETDGG